jgi:shikimate dehydrogenase
VPTRAAVLGRPVAHSLSPVLHRAAYQALGLDWSYDAVDVGEPELPGFVAGLGPEWAGLSLTMPLKRAALAVAADATPLARAVGAANTLLPRAPGGILADNTDVAGILATLSAAGVAEPAQAVVLGAGGTAAAALAALRELGTLRPTVLVRDRARAVELGAAGERLGVRPGIRSWGDVRAAVADAELVVSTVPAGAADSLADLPWTRRTVVLDVVYAPWPTPLAGAALAAGCQVASGLDMLLHQAAAQVTLMTGQPAPLAAMRSALHAATG